MTSVPRRFHKSERKVVDEGPPFTFTPERRAALDDILTKYPPDRKRSAVLAALYLLHEQAGYLTGNGIADVAPESWSDAGQVEDVASYYVMFLPEAGRQVRAPGVPDPVMCAFSAPSG